MNKFILYLFAAILFSSCLKEEIKSDVKVEPDTPVTVDSVILWKVALCQKDSSVYISNKPFLTEDGGVIFTQDLCPDFKSLNGGRVFCYEKETGELRWSQYMEENVHATASTGLNSGYFWVWDRGQLRVFDVRNGDLIRSEYYPRGTAFASDIGEYIYFNLESKLKNHVVGDTTYICRTKPGNYEVDTFYTLSYDQEGYRPFLTAPSLYIEENGDSSLIYGNRSLRYSRLRFSLFKLNLENKEIVWTSETLSDQGPYRPPIINDGKIYVNGVWSVHCVDISDGQEIWKRLDVGGTSISEAIVINDVFIVKDHMKTLYALDKFSGTTIWVNEKTGYPSTYTTMDSHGDYIWTNISDAHEAKLNQIDSRTGEIIWKYESPRSETNRNGSFSSGMTIDKEENMIYSSDEVFSMAIRIPGN